MAAASKPAPLLPGQLMWMVAVIPLLTGSLPSALTGDISWGEAARETLALYLPFLAIPALLILFYRSVGPTAVARIGRREARVLFHVGATAAIAAGGGAVLFPPYRLLAREPLVFPEWLLTCIANAWVITLPALWIVALTREAEKKQLRVVEARLEALQARINPHFLFNSLNTVASLIGDKPDVAETVVERLGGAFRYVLDTSNRPLVPLSEEVAFADDLLTIHGARFEESLRFELDVEAGLEGVMVPSLLMQALIENAILHGVSSRGEGTVKVVVRRDGEALVVEVWDDGIGPGESAHRGSGTALADLRQRLALLYGEEASFSLGAESGMTCARVRLPLVPHEDPDRRR